MNGSYTAGVRAQRDQIREETVDLAMQITAAIRAYASDQNNLELMAKMKISKSALTYASHPRLITYLDAVLLEMTPLVNDLADYGVVQTTVDAFIQKRDTLIAKLLSPRIAVIKRKDNAKQLIKLHGEINDLLHLTMDQLIKVIEKDAPSLAEQYFSVRMLIIATRSSGGDINNKSQML